jgi:hypothetical protein
MGVIGERVSLPFIAAARFAEGVARERIASWKWSQNPRRSAFRHGDT